MADDTPRIPSAPPTGANPAATPQHRPVPGGDELRLVANLTPKTQVLTSEGPAWRVLLDSDAELFGGTGTVEPLAPYQCLLYEARR